MNRLNEFAADGFAWIEAGEGVPLILLHGIGSGAASWEDQIAGFADRYRVVAWDAPGYGESAPLDSPAPAASDYAEALNGFLRAVGVDRFHLVGHSLGALMACAFARLWPDRILSLLIASPAAGYGTADAELREARRAARLDLLDELGPEGVARERHGALLSDSAPPRARERVRSVMARIRPGGYRQAVEMLSAGDICADARQIGLSATVVVGGADRVTPPDGCRDVARSFARSRFEVLPGLGHACYVEGPDAFNGVLAAHLERAE